jgi:hypothetical protein
MPKEPRFDVVIYELATRKVDRVVGSDMARDTGYYNAERRLDTALSRINDLYNAAIVKAGKYKEGDVLKPADLK